MTIQEAIKSGKMFKRPMHEIWYTRDTFEQDHLYLGFSLSSLLADDWETKPEPMVIWANVYENYISGIYEAREDAEFCLNRGGVTKKFVEVIE